MDRMGQEGHVLLQPDSGNFGVVRRGVDTRTKEPRAIKHIKKGTPQSRERVLNEIKVMQVASGSDPAIVTFYEHFEEWNHFDLVFEFCANGTLDDQIEAKLDQRAAALFSHQLLGALACLRDKGVLHRDVKPANVLLKDSYTCKLADFGSACLMAQTERLFERAGTPAFWPPEMEMLPKGNGYSLPYDMWSMGITLYWMLFHKHPWVSQGKLDSKQLRHADFDFGMMQMTNPKCFQLLRWLLMPSPEQRIHPFDAVEHTWLGSHGFGNGSFSQPTPSPRLVPDSQGRWMPDRTWRDEFEVIGDALRLSFRGN